MFTTGGVWRITPVVRGTGSLTIEQAPEDDESHRTDQATIVGPVAWVVQGINSAMASKVPA